MSAFELGAANGTAGSATGLFQWGAGAPWITVPVNHETSSSGLPFYLTAISFGHYRPPQSVVSLEGADGEPLVVRSAMSIGWHGAIVSG